MSVSASSISGVIAASTTESIFLEGTDGTPVSHIDEATSIAEVTYEFQADGDLFVDRRTFADFFLTDWVTNAPPNRSYWIKATQAGVTGPGDTPNGTSDTLNVWHSMSVQREWGWLENSNFENRTGKVRIDISTDVSGSPIVATGYYQGNADVDSEQH